MSNEFDVRENKTSEIEIIRFYSPDAPYTKASTIQKFTTMNPFSDGEGVVIVEENSDGSEGEYVWVETREDADNLIAALNKAKELGWLK